jgi:hypothetical protein
MSITLDLPSDVRRRLDDRAARAGLEPSKYVEALVIRDLDRRAAADRALAPFRAQVAESRMTDDELDAFFEDVRDEVWREKHPKAAGP